MQELDRVRRELSAAASRGALHHALLLTGEGDLLETARYAVIVVSVVPVVMVYPWIQKYFHKGALIGAVKG